MPADRYPLARLADLPDDQPYFDTMAYAFGWTRRPEDLGPIRRLTDPAWSLVARDGDVVVGTAGAYDLTMALPGAVAPIAGVTQVSVRPTHRRQGVLTSLMRRQLDDLHAAGRPLAVLFASEPSIYGRFGYGMACTLMQVRMPTSRAGFGPHAPAPSGSRRLGRAVDLRADLVAVRDAHWASRPGAWYRTAAWWDRVLQDAPDHRDGHTELRAFVHDGPDGPDGYATYRTRLGWSDEGADGHLEVVEVIGERPARADLWRAVLSHDLMQSASFWIVPDDPLLFWLAQPYRGKHTVGDDLWVRLVDVAPALALRRYASPIDVVLQVADASCPWNAGRYRLAYPGGDAAATCTRVDDPPDLVLDVRSLGAAYLGSTRLGSLAAAGLVDERTPGALARADAAFGWPVLAGSPDIF